MLNENCFDFFSEECTASSECRKYVPMAYHIYYEFDDNAPNKATKIYENMIKISWLRPYIVFGKFFEYHMEGGNDIMDLKVGIYLAASKDKQMKRIIE